MWGATWGEFMDIWKAFGWVTHADRLYQLKSYQISSQVSSLMFSFLRNRQLQLDLNKKCLEKGKGFIHTRVCQGSIFGPNSFLLYINDIQDDGI